MHPRIHPAIILLVALALLGGISTLPFAIRGAVATPHPAASRSGKATPQPIFLQSNLLGKLVPVTLHVPARLGGPPFDQPRTLNVPAGFSISVYARIADARFMVLTPDGNLLVSQPGLGTITLVRPRANGNPLISTYVRGLNGPQGMAFHTIGAVTYLYVGEVDQIDRFVWHQGSLVAGPLQVVIPNLPYQPTADGDTHPYKDIAFGPDNKLYVDIGSSCNVCTGDRQSNPERAAIYQFNPDGSGEWRFAQGLRNPEGLIFVPGTSTLWVTANERDNIAYPVPDSTGQYGKVLPAYVDNHPPDEFTAVKPGGDYGWPYCNPNPFTKSGYNNMPFDPDYQLNQSGSFNPHGAVVNCNDMNPISMGIQAHSAPLGITFLQGTKFPSLLQPGAVIALHGSWDRTVKTGYKVVYYRWLKDSGSGHAGSQEDLVTGWLDSQGQNWDRPVDVVVDPAGNLLISADDSGTIYKLSYQG
jgi:glucose/arabinose dehydrogenase